MMTPSLRLLLCCARRIRRATATGLALGLLALFCAGTEIRAQPAGDGEDLQGMAAGEQPVQIEADNALEWDREDQFYVARGNARASQGDLSIRAEELKAYYKLVEGENQDYAIQRIEARGDVVITTPRQTASGDTAFYDLGERRAVMRGADLRLETDGDIIRAEDRFEYDLKDNVVRAVGKASARRADTVLKSDVLTATLTKDESGQTRIDKVHAAGGKENPVEIVTPDERVLAREAFYNPAKKMAELVGSVQIDRGPNALVGARAEVDFDSGRATLLGSETPGEKGRVFGVFYPESTSESTGDPSGTDTPSGQSAP